MKSHEDKVNTVFRQIFGSEVANKTDKTFLYMGGVYPDHSLTLVIGEKDRSKFKSPPEVYFKNQLVLVYGLIEMHKGRLQITIRDTAQFVKPTL